jgi:hypothetical protein
MKKHLVVAAGLAVLSTGAFASKVRMMALNQGSSLGSFYLEDNRNVFRSSNSVNSMNNYVITEWGTTGSAASSEGGFFRSHGAMNYGLYFNSGAHGNVDNNLSPARVDLVVGGDAGLNWGLRLGYESMEAAGLNHEASGFDLGLSATVSGANLWLNYAPATTSTNAGNETEANADMRLGATYGMGDYTLFAEYASEGGTGSQDAATSITVGAAKVWETSGGATVFYDAKIVSESNLAHAADTSKLSVPVTLGVEVKAASWLTWRASIQQSVYGAQEAANGDKTSGRTTQLGAGASLTWGDLQIDGTIANAGAKDLGTDSNFMGSVAALYRF